MPAMVDVILTLAASIMALVVESEEVMFFITIGIIIAIIGLTAC